MIFWLLRRQMNAGGARLGGLAGWLCRRRARDERGFTFFEIMATLAVLSVGIVFVNRALLVTLDFQDGLSQRLYAQGLLNNELAVLQQKYAQKGAVVPSQSQNRYDAVVNNKSLHFTVTSEFSAVDNLDSLQRVYLVVAWESRSRTLNLRREGYLLTFISKEQGEGHESPP